MSIGLPRILAGANMWNYIPVAIRLCNIVTTFKICIKTCYLFNLGYPINHYFYHTPNILCWQVLLFNCEGCGYFFILISSYVFYSLFNAFEYCKNYYIFDITLHEYIQRRSRQMARTLIFLIRYGWKSVGFVIMLMC